LLIHSRKSFTIGKIDMTGIEKVEITHKVFDSQLRTRTTDSDLWFTSKDLQLKLFEMEMKGLKDKSKQVLSSMKRLNNSEDKFRQFVETSSSVANIDSENKKILLEMGTSNMETYKLNFQAEGILYDLSKDYVGMMKAVMEAQNDRFAALAKLSASMGTNTEEVGNCEHLE